MTTSKMANLNTLEAISKKIFYDNALYRERFDSLKEELLAIPAVEFISYNFLHFPENYCTYLAVEYIMKIQHIPISGWLSIIEKTRNQAIAVTSILQLLVSYFEINAYDFFYSLDIEESVLDYTKKYSAPKRVPYYQYMPHWADRFNIPAWIENPNIIIEKLTAEQKILFQELADVPLVKICTERVKCTVYKEDEAGNWIAMEWPE